MTRGPEEYYYSAPRRIKDGEIPSEAVIEAEIPEKCQVLISFRRAISEELLDAEPWSEEIESNEKLPYIPGIGDIYQYRLNLKAVNSLRTPRVTAVKISLKKV